jgi:hypothetical protein
VFNPTSIKTGERMKALILLIFTFNVFASQNEVSILNENKKGIEIIFSKKKKLFLSSKKWTSFKLSSIKPKNTPVNIALNNTPGVLFQVTKVKTLDKNRLVHCKKLKITSSCKKKTIDEKSGIVEDFYVVENFSDKEGILYYISLKYNLSQLNNKELRRVLGVINEKVK